MRHAKEIDERDAATKAQRGAHESIVEELRASGEKAAVRASDFEDSVKSLQGRKFRRRVTVGRGLLPPPDLPPVRRPTDPPLLQA